MFQSLLYSSVTQVYKYTYIFTIAVNCMYIYIYSLGFPGSSDGKESSRNAGDPGSIPGSERSPREGIGIPLQYSWVSLVAQTVKNSPAMRET